MASISKDGSLLHLHDESEEHLEASEQYRKFYKKIHGKEPMIVTKDSLEELLKNSKEEAKKYTS